MCHRLQVPWSGLSVLILISISVLVTSLLSLSLQYTVQRHQAVTLHPLSWQQPTGMHSSGCVHHAYHFTQKIKATSWIKQNMYKRQDAQTCLNQLRTFDRDHMCMHAPFILHIFRLWQPRCCIHLTLTIHQVSHCNATCQQFLLAHSNSLHNCTHLHDSNTYMCEFVHNQYVWKQSVASFYIWLNGSVPVSFAYPVVLAQNHYMSSHLSMVNKMC